ncbi:MAG: hypothetical protein QG568_762 [Patescibacteria group bacterium]|nr:hypothetical protein [Patescibacteria group bacterium]
MRITLSFSRVVARNIEEMSNLNFTEGDYYDIYNHMVLDEGFENNSEKINRLAGFRIISISKDGVHLEKIALPVCTEYLTLNSKVELDFSYYGIYTITLVSIED